MELFLQAHLLLSSAPNVLDDITLPQEKELEGTLAKLILNGRSYQVVDIILKELSQKVSVDENDDSKSLLQKVKTFISTHFTTDKNVSLIFAIALLQTFLQNNYTGPLAPIDIFSLFFETSLSNETIDSLLVSSLTVLGQPAYELTEDPIYLILSLLLLEQITEQPSLFDLEDDREIDIPKISTAETPASMAVAHWWRARALMAQLSLLPEATGYPSMISSSILQSIDIAHIITKSLPESTPEDVKKAIYVIYYLENVKSSLAINTEHLCLPSLTKVKKLTNFQFVLTGARTKRTKFQQKAHSGLIILAKSSWNLHENKESIMESKTPETFELNDDLLLEKPHFESIGSEPLDEQIVKRQKLDEDEEKIIEDKLLPMAIRQEYIPQELQDLDPNEQPALSNYDNIQLLLRLYTIRQTSPAKDPLVEEELASLINRIIYQTPADNANVNEKRNWTIFARSLWERSMVETTRAKTIERGLLQMQSLVEELGLKIQTRLIPQGNANADNDESLAVISRLKYIHQLPFLPRWELDAQLAEKYMSVGILRSAVEIYDRLHMHCESALCYAAVGDEKKAESILTERVESNPSDSRAWSILGDIRQEPALWEKSWSIGKYVNAKNSLARYYYNPPQHSGLTRDYNIVLKHLNDSLRQYSLNFETWYFYGCVALECGKMDVAAEAFSRCVSLDQTHAMAWSNLSAAYVELNKLKEAHSCLKRAIASDAQKNWRIWENYMLVSVKLNEWDDVLVACRQLVDIRRDTSGEGSIDLPIVEKLIELLVSSDYPYSGDTNETEGRLTHYQKSCLEFVCNTLPSVITTNPRCWRLVAKVEIWRKRPWAALECYEKAYRAISHNPDLEIDEKIWNETVDACEELVSAYESLGEMEGKYGKSSFVCKDWKYKARSTIKGLMSKGKGRWDDTDGWEKLLEVRNQI
ncbi:tetratricopeptide repeat-containing protein EMW1 NDAI_0G03870 [Naumovozyma dairenensis CBS 421]|uniref:Uncharacterized protein n=1 Tax=Naumovozyma dairenensis (strain ATCC 10597 / BCRC 20456 / CBS 421 / NBRC 0211 / NRRL Y-12639) TaxID=1071378 RepID=G0WEF3_NAUDC|nr:hypothetical protein NDAI_0G03870 [Naumovozyma dairenensis CBS 421]CCD26164.2 hypothetical protein NDAI_0G03870 [Naumovozyma dairenensis CBS 421]